MKGSRLALLSALMLSAFACAAQALPRQSAEDFLRVLYMAEAERVAHSRPLPEGEFLALFTPKIARALSAAMAHPGPAMGREAGPNALFGWGVVPGTQLRFIGVSAVLGTGYAPTLIVDVVVAGEPRRIVIDLVEDEGSWRIAGIAYDKGEDFVSFETRPSRR